MNTRSHAQHRVFFSYSWDDREVVNHANKRCKEHGAEVWRDIFRMTGGDNLPERISGALEWCTTLVLFWSRSASASRWVKLEWTNALVLRKRIIPCKLDGTPLPGILANLVYVDFRDATDDCNDLLNAIFGRSSPDKHSPRPRKTRSRPPLVTEDQSPSCLQDLVAKKGDFQTIALLLVASVQEAIDALVKRQGTPGGIPILGSGDSLYSTPEVLHIRRLQNQQKAKIVDALADQLALGGSYRERCGPGLAIIGALEPFPEDIVYKFPGSREANLKYLSEIGISNACSHDWLLDQMASMMYDCWL